MAFDYSAAPRTYKAPMYQLSVKSESAAELLIIHQFCGALFKGVAILYPPVLRIK